MLIVSIMYDSMPNITVYPDIWLLSLSDQIIRVTVIVFSYEVKDTFMCIKGGLDWCFISGDLLGYALSVSVH